MKQFRFILLAVLVLALLLGYWALKNKLVRQAVSNPATEDKAYPNESRIGEKHNATTQLPADIATFQAENLMKLTNAIYEGEQEWRTLIDFFGQVVDEKTNLIEGASIHFTWTDLSPAGTSEKQTLSDAQGGFALRGMRGKFLSVKVSKNGYYAYKPRGEGFFYAGEDQNFAPDENNPVVFRLHKMGQADRLVATEFPGFAQIEQLRRDGTPVEINLAEARKVLSDGQIRMEFWGDPVQKTNRVFNWKVRITVPGGGIMATIEEFNFSAPEKGYLPYVETDMLASSAQWESSIKRKYFIKLADGNYGRMDFDFLARNGVYRIHSYINPSGSRNLEYDEAAQTKPTIHE